MYDDYTQPFSPSLNIISLEQNIDEDEYEDEYTITSPSITYDNENDLNQTFTSSSPHTIQTPIEYTSQLKETNITTRSINDIKCINNMMSNDVYRLKSFKQDCPYKFPYDNLVAIGFYYDKEAKIVSLKRTLFDFISHVLNSVLYCNVLNIAGKTFVFNSIYMYISFTTEEILIVHTILIWPFKHINITK